MPRSFIARAGSDVRKVMGQPFVLAYERPQLRGIDPDNMEMPVKAKKDIDIMGDGSPNEMVDMAIAIGVMLDRMNPELWDRVDRDVKKHRADRRNSPWTVESPVQRPVNHPLSSASDPSDADSSAVA